MNNQKNKYISYIKKYEFLATVIVVVIFVSYLVINLMIPNIIKAGEIHRNIDSMRIKLANLEKKDRILSSIDENLIRNNFVKLNYVVPENKDYALLFTTLDRIQGELGVAITRTDFELGSVSTSSSNFKKSQVGDTFAIPISLEVMGTITQIEKFLMQLSDLSGRLITVDQIKLEVSEGSVVKASLTGKTFYNPLPKTIGKVDSAIPEFNNNYKVIFDKILENQLPIEIIQEANQEVPIGKENLFL